MNDDQYPVENDVSGEAAPAAPKDYKDVLSKVVDRWSDLTDLWVKKAERVWSIYTGDEEGIPFNILYSNTETIVPAVFSKTPIAQVLRRFDEARADMPAKVMQRMLSFLMDTNLPSYPAFMTAMEDSVLDAAIAGQGQVRVRLVNGLATIDYVSWKKFCWGYCERWEDCPWIAFAHDLTAEEIIKEFQLDDVAAAKFKAASNAGDSIDNDKATGEKKPDTIRVWEVMDRKSGKTCFLCSGAENSCLSEEPDTLQLSGFYPCPPPLNFVRSTTDTLPRPLYKLYQTQAEELNELTRRLQKVVRAIKAKGIYAGNVDAIISAFNQDDDNILVPGDATAQILQMNKGLDAYIWFLPIDILMKVAGELFQARDAVKQTIYEILGIGDILRGVSKASETLGAQKIKSDWGSLRINKLRERTGSFVRETLRIAAEISAKHTPPELWTQVTGVKLLTPQQVQMAMSAPPQAGPDGQPIPNPAMDPMKTWEGVLGILKSDLSRAYTIDVETNSMVDAAATGEKEDAAEFMQAVSQTLGSLKDIMLSSPQGWEAGKLVATSVMGKFAIGAEMVPQFRNLPPPRAVMGPPPEVQKMMQEAQKGKQDAEKASQAAKADQQTLKDMLAEASRTQDAIKSQSDSLAMQREAFRREQDVASANIELLRDQSVIRIKEEELKLASKETALAAKEASLVGREKALAQNRTRPPGGPK
jgi:hypothetical protein